MGLSSAQTQTLKSLLASAPDDVLVRLTAALSSARARDALFGPVCDLARAETEDRYVRDLVLKPLKPLADPRVTAPKRALIPPDTLGRLWRLMAAAAPAGVAKAREEARYTYVDEDETNPFYDALARAAADALRAPSPAIQSPFADPSVTEVVIKLLDLLPVLRRAQPLASYWVRHPCPETTASIRLAYKDAAARAEDCGELFMEAVLLYLEEPAQVLRIFSLMMDRPTDRFLADSELGGLCGRLLQDVQDRVHSVRQFNPSEGPGAGAAEAESVLVASRTLREFEEWIELSSEGPWCGRVPALKSALASAVEKHLEAAEAVLSQALPLKRVRLLAAAQARAEPRIDGYPNDGVVCRASGLFAFLSETRSCAAYAGFGSVRNKVSDALEYYLDNYVEDLVERLRSPDCSEPDWVRAYLDVAADFAGTINGASAAQIIRRRAAA